ncbi:glycerophosphodiester phosphodiesterase family protein [Nordella sp. HKS 07]|uniref:glycerophosphodiester phosphodiesterase family protein n=1 Tax=Nordella sp. HKS 07 TaxID=2712222 RepID=UPI001FEE2890|nr:glycerophosphodiester phosphodiesterase family protein [Nordella sp. HKS 07]
MPMPSALRPLDWLTARPIAHRGLHDAKNGAIENTRSAFARAIAQNYAIECDLQMAGDGEAVVFHDETLDRLMEGKGRVCDHSAAELQAMAFKSGADRIQTLGELLDQVQGRVPLVIELKSLWDGNETLARRAVAVVSNYGGPCCLMSFDPGVIAEVRRLAPDLVRGIVADSFTHEDYDNLPEAERGRLRELAHLGQTEPDFISYYWRELPLPAVTRFREAGHPVICWTIRSAADIPAALRVSDQITFEGFLA